MIYANEIDPVACAVLRHCDLADHVDERSIKDVRAGDVGSFRRAHFFAGAGLWEIAARLAGWPQDRVLWTGSCPCQPLSVAGQRKGHVDARHLWPSFYRLIAECRPATIVGEQVASKDGREWLAGVRADLESLGYACGAANLPACSVGAPHKRSRLWWVAVADSERAGAGDNGRTLTDEGRRAVDSRGEGLRRRNGAVVSGRTASGDACRPMADADRGRQQERAQCDGEPFTGIEASRRNDIKRCSAYRKSGPMADAECEQANEKQQRSETDEGGRCSDGSGGRALDSFWSAAVGRDAAEWITECKRYSVCAYPNVCDLKPGQCVGKRRTREEWIDIEDGVLGDASEQGLSLSERETLLSTGRRGEGRATQQPNGSFWSDSIWLNCADGKARRTKPGLRLLVDGMAGRTDLWRLAGNSIVPQLAAQILGALLDREGEAMS